MKQMAREMLIQRPYFYVRDTPKWPIALIESHGAKILESAWKKIPIMYYKHSLFRYHQMAKMQKKAKLKGIFSSFNMAVNTFHFEQVMKYIMPNSIVLSKYEARDFILDQTLQTRHRHHRMDPKMRRSALSQSRAHTQCCFKNEKIVHSTWVSLHWPLMLPKYIIRYPNPKFKYILH